MVPSGSRLHLHPGNRDPVDLPTVCRLVTLASFPPEDPPNVSEGGGDGLTLFVRPFTPSSSSRPDPREPRARVTAVPTVPCHPLHVLPRRAEPSSAAARRM